MIGACFQYMLRYLITPISDDNNVRSFIHHSLLETAYSLHENTKYALYMNYDFRSDDVEIESN